MNPHVARILAHEYRTLNMKTIIPDLPDIARDISDAHPDALVAFVRHEPEEGVAHYHLVVRFCKPTHLKKYLENIAERDPCFYAAPCRIFRASYRYLAHLDNPEKHTVPIDEIVRMGNWDGIPLADWHQKRRINCEFSELVAMAREYHIETKQNGDVTTPVRFAMWLENKSLNPRSALASLRMMGISWAELMEEAAQTAKEK